MRNNPESTDVMLVSMPFAPLYKPSIGLSLLDASLAGSGISSRVCYMMMLLADKLGDEQYKLLSEDLPNAMLIGEWVFAEELFPGHDRWDFVDEIVNAPPKTIGFAEPTPEVVDKIIQARRAAAEVVNRSLDIVCKADPGVVGFTSVFQQHTASLALARRIREALPDTKIIFGGSNCESVMGGETLRQFPFIDAVVSGEADLVFHELVQRLLDGKSADDMGGVYTRANIDRRFDEMSFESAPRVEDMDALPLPAFHSYFEQFRSASSSYVRKTPDVLFETSRGCWWGEKSHCTFCGLNGSGMAYRSKSASRALDELRYLKNEYPGCTIDVVDNILDMSYFDDFVPDLADLNVTLFYETKSNLSKAQLRLLKQAGITQIQPGIESLSTDVLALMGKGVSAMQNVRLLKWCSEVGIHPYWSLIFGFPGEKPESYTEMATLVPKLTHLTPPLASGPIHLDRFSPNFDRAEEFGFVDVRPAEPYRYVYPLDDSAVANIAYFFDYDYRDQPDVEQYTTPLVEELARWQAVGADSSFFYGDVDGELHLRDYRPQASGVISSSRRRNELTVLSGIDRILYLECDRIRSLKSLRRRLREQGIDINENELIDRLNPLVSGDLLMAEGERYLSLATPVVAESRKASMLHRLFNRSDHA